MKELQHLNKYFAKYKGRLFLGLIITVVARIFMLFTPQLVGNSVNVVERYLNGEITSESIVRNELLWNIGLIVGATLIAALFTFLMRQTFIVVSRHIEYDLKN